MEEPWLLLCFPHLSQSAFVYHQDQPHSGSTDLSELGPPLSIINQEKCLTLFPTGQEYGGFFFFNWDSFFPVKCSLFKVNTNRIDKQIKTRQPTRQVISLIGKQNIQMKRWKLVSIDKQHIYIYFVKEIQTRWQRSTGKLETNADGDWGQREPSFLFVGL